jgi:hypothetical protein
MSCAALAARILLGWLVSGILIAFVFSLFHEREGSE